GVAGRRELGARLGAASGEGAQAERPAGPVGQHDGAALGIEDGDGIVEDRLQQVFLAVEVDEVATGAQHGVQLFARTRAAVTVEGQPLQRLVPGGPGGGLDAQLLGRGEVGVLFFREGLDDDGKLAKLQEVADAERPLAGADADAVEARAVGAAEIADPPAPLGRAQLGVEAADRAVVEHDFQRGEAPHAEQGGRLPGLPLDGAVDPAQPDEPLHNDLLYSEPVAAQQRTRLWATNAFTTVPVLTTIGRNWAVCRGPFPEGHFLCRRRIQRGKEQTGG